MPMHLRDVQILKVLDNNEFEIVYANGDLEVHHGEILNVEVNGGMSSFDITYRLPAVEYRYAS